MKIAVAIPALNAADHLPACLIALGEATVVVCDGGSVDNTALIARSLGATVIQGPRGRGSQLSAAVDRAIADGAEGVVLLHADTILSAGWQQAARAVLSDPANRGKAGYFRLAFNDTSASARRVAALANWRARTFGLPYGDQGLVLSAQTWRAVGGLKPLPLMEDVDLVRRIGRRNLVPLSVTATTSAERYHRDGWWWRPMRNLLCLSLFLLGVAPATIARLYHK